MTDYYDTWFWTTNRTSNTCPGTGGFKCIGPDACARDPNTGKRYCCDAGNDSVCWTGSSPCSTDGSTFECGSGSNKWCCLNKRETCTQTGGQINICWNVAPDTLRNISLPAISSVYSSASAANPSASSLTFNPVSIIALTAPPASTTASSASRSSSPTASATTTPAEGVAGSAASPAGGRTASAAPDSSTGLSGGTIAGIAIGAAAAVAVLALGAFFIWRRNKRKSAAYGGLDAPPDPQVSQVGPFGDPANQQQQQYSAYAPTHATTVSPYTSELRGSDGSVMSSGATVYQEAYGKIEHGDGRTLHSVAAEMGGNTPAVELPAPHAAWGAGELAGDHSFTTQQRR